MVREGVELYTVSGSGLGVGKVGLGLMVWEQVNTNNHQQLWGVLAAALFTLADWMSGTGNVGAVHFFCF